ncbi:MAG: alanyl-tRNA editing protein [Candidatus Heimdallarchaeota archaeon]|nr:alanyl-tRNA editing protein [Candidatus Heimdallarchaeota archaeon]
MTKTDMLYMEDNYTRSFSAEVIDKGEDYVVLDRTAFYPEGGGQETDKGQLIFDDKTLTIRKVKKEGGKVKHFIEESDQLPGVGETVQCKLDWERRFTHMRYHTAIHILSSYMKKHFDAEVVGNNISVRKARADFAPLEALSDEELVQIEKGVNEIIDRDYPVKISFMPREEAIAFLEKKGYQTDYIDMVPKSVKIFRVISVDDYDHASCAGTHVANTSEIGKITVVKRRNMGTGKERITLALADE